MMGGALGLAVLASLAAARSEAMQASSGAAAVLNSGYHVAFLFGAVFAAAAGVLGGLLLRPGQAGRATGEHSDVSQSAPPSAATAKPQARSNA